jgi:hypothetical protein
MSSLIPPGSQMILIGSAASLNDLSAFSPMEEGTAEGSLMLMRLDFADFPTGDALATLDKALRDAGVPAWPGYSFVVYADIFVPTVYLAWQKGIAWMPIIIGIAAITVLPMLLGGLVWLILPQSLKDFLNGLVGLGMMLVVMYIMSQVMKPLSSPAKTKQVAKPKELEGVKT